MTFIWFCLISYGLTQIIVYGKVLDPVRPKTGWFGKLFRCSMCVGFWVGLFLWFVKDCTQLFIFDDSIITGLLLGFASSGASYIGNTVFGDDGIKFEYLNKKERE